MRAHGVFEAIDYCIAVDARGWQKEGVPSPCGRRDARTAVLNWLGQLVEAGLKDVAGGSQHVEVLVS